MERNPYRLGRGGAARLRLEGLEDRSLLAVAAFEVNLYRDVGGTPGEPVTNETIAVGESFFVEITAQEFDPSLSGLGAVALDIAWDPAALAEIDSPFDPGALVTPLLPAFQTGTLDPNAGTIDNLAGAAFLASHAGRAIGASAPERFALLHFRAMTATVNTALTMQEGRSSIVAVPTATFVAGQFNFERQLITIVEGSRAQPEFEVNVYQGSEGAPPTLITADAVDAADDFFVEIIVEPPPTAPPPTGGWGVDRAADAIVSGEIDEPSDATSSPTQLVISSLPPFAGRAFDFSAGRLLICEVYVHVHDVTVTLPLAAFPVNNVVLAPHNARRIGLTYWPQVPQAVPVDAVFGTAHNHELMSAGTAAEIDDAWMQALASGLAAADNKSKASDPFVSHPI